MASIRSLRWRLSALVALNGERLGIAKPFDAQDGSSLMQGEWAERALLMKGRCDVGDLDVAFAPGVGLENRLILAQEQDVADLVVAIHDAQIVGLIALHDGLEQADP